MEDKVEIVVWLRDMVDNTEGDIEETEESLSKITEEIEDAQKRFDDLREYLGSVRRLRLELLATLEILETYVFEELPEGLKWRKENEASKHQD